MLDEPSANDVTNVLLNINRTILTMGEYLKRLHEQQDKLHTSAESAKKAILASHRQSESDTNKVFDSELGTIRRRKKRQNKHRSGSK